MAIQISTDTELSAVNSILGSIGQAPITTLQASGGIDPLANPEISFVKNLLDEVSKDVQTIGWTFNSEYKVKKSPDAQGNYVVPSNAILYDISNGQIDRSTNVVKRDGKLFDTINQTDVFSGEYYFDIVTLYPFQDVPPAIQRYIIARASMRAATQLVSNADLVKLLQVEEEQARANAMEFETQQGDHNFMGFDQQTNYRAYQPYKALIR
tara:strand:+ start:417 stop:1046 length:630 start_codon:yes stop_codon:yes gene_type:complete